MSGPDKSQVADEAEPRPQILPRAPEEPSVGRGVGVDVRHCGDSLLTRPTARTLSCLLIAMLLLAIGPGATPDASALTFCTAHNTDLRVSAKNDVYSPRWLVWGCRGKPKKNRPGLFYTGNWPVWQFKDVRDNRGCLRAYYRTGRVSVRPFRHAYNYRKKTRWRFMNVIDCR